MALQRNRGFCRLFWFINLGFDASLRFLSFLSLAIQSIIHKYRAIFAAESQRYSEPRKHCASVFPSWIPLVWGAVIFIGSILFIVLFNIPLIKLIRASRIHTAMDDAQELGTVGKSISPPPFSLSSTQQTVPSSQVGQETPQSTELGGNFPGKGDTMIVNKQQKKKKSQHSKASARLTRVAIKQATLTCFVVVTTVIGLIILGVGDITMFLFVDAIVDATCIVLMYAMYDKEYQWLCGRVHRSVERCTCV